MTTASPSEAYLPHLVISDGTVEALKWVALMLMTGDHINAYLFNWSLPWLYNAGRLVMPLFGFVLAYNLARPGAMMRDAHLRTLKRLALYGFLAAPAYIHLHGLWPFNILWMLCLFTFIVYCIERDSQWFTAIGWSSFVFGGLFVEFWWFALAFCLGAWWYCKRPSVLSLSAWLVGAVSLQVVNHNCYALLTLPVVAVASRIELSVPRIRQVFYIYYPAHLTILVVLGFYYGRR